MIDKCVRIVQQTFEKDEEFFFLERAKDGYCPVVEDLVDEPTVFAEAWATEDGDMSSSTESMAR